MLLKYFKKNSIVIVIITNYLQIITIRMHYNEIGFLLMDVRSSAKSYQKRHKMTGTTMPDLLANFLQGNSLPFGIRSSLHPSHTKMASLSRSTLIL